MAEVPVAPSPACAGTGIAWFQDLGRHDVARAGGKGANLGELTRAGLPVPPGFVVLAGAYLRAMEAAGVRDELRAIAERAVTEDPAALQSMAARAQSLVRSVSMPVELRAELVAAYRVLGDRVRVLWTA